MCWRWRWRQTGPVGRRCRSGSRRPRPCSPAMQAMSTLSTATPHRSAIDGPTGCARVARGGRGSLAKAPAGQSVHAVDAADAEKRLAARTRGAGESHRGTGRGVRPGSQRPLGARSQPRACGLGWTKPGAHTARTRCRPGRLTRRARRARLTPPAPVAIGHGIAARAGGVDDYHATAAGSDHRRRWDGYTSRPSVPASGASLLCFAAAGSTGWWASAATFNQCGASPLSEDLP
jgi:hypothetical protein